MFLSQQVRHAKAVLCKNEVRQARAVVESEETTETAPAPEPPSKNGPPRASTF